MKTAKDAKKDDVVEMLICTYLEASLRNAG